MLYAITDRRLYGGNEAESRQRLLEQAAVWAASGVAFVHLREKDLSSRELAELARAMLRQIRQAQREPGVTHTTKLLINSRGDIALAVGADGVHLPSGPDALTPEEVRSIYTAAGCTQPPVISTSCHRLAEVEAARRANVDCILFAPVFEKIIFDDTSRSDQRKLPGTGLSLLGEACRIASHIPVFALGGITVQNAAQCLDGGAAGIAAIRLLQEPAATWEKLA